MQISIRVCGYRINCFSMTQNRMKIQDPAEIPGDFSKQLWVEPLVWEICPRALLKRNSKHFSCHGAMVCRASGFYCGDIFKKQRFCHDSEDISSTLQYSSEQMSLIAILLPLRISREQGVRKETKDNGGYETEHQGRSGSNFSQHAATSNAELPETLGGKCWH